MAAFHLQALLDWIASLSHHDFVEAPLPAPDCSANFDSLLAASQQQPSSSDQFSLCKTSRMPPPGKKRKVEDRDWADSEPGPYQPSVPTTSRARAMAEAQAVKQAMQQDRSGRQNGENGRDDPAPVVLMNQLPPSAVHKYLRHYGLVPLPSPLPQSHPLQGPAPINYTQSVFPTPPISTSAVERSAEPPEAEEGLELLKSPAPDGQEPQEADARLVDVARQHWEAAQLKEGETIVTFIYALRMKDRHIKMPTPV